MSLLAIWLYGAICFGAGWALRALMCEATEDLARDAEALAREEARGKFPRVSREGRT